MKIIISANSDPTKFMHDEVAHLHAFLAWMQSQNSCLIDSLLLGRQRIHCLEMKASTMLALHLFNSFMRATTLCQMDHMKAASFPTQSISHIWDH